MIPDENERLVSLYWKRDEQAIRETEDKYGPYLFRIADNILGNEEDSREVINDTYFKAWCSIPPHRPENLSAFLAKIPGKGLSISIEAGNRRNERIPNIKCLWMNWVSAFPPVRGQKKLWRQRC